MGHTAHGSLRSLESLYWTSPFGPVCYLKEVLCRRCGHLETFSIPSDVVSQIDEPDLVGDMMVDILIQQSGWIYHAVTRNDGNKCLFVLCPDCIDADLDAYYRFQEFYSGR